VDKDKINKRKQERRKNNEKQDRRDGEEVMM
jgi:hypothetical protein